MASDVWASKRYADLRDLTLNGAPLALQQWGHGAMLDAVVERVAAYAGGALPYERAVDLACGDGMGTVKFLRVARSVVGVDVNESFLEAARSRAPREVAAGVLRYERGTLEGYDDFADVGLVGCGGAMMFVDDDAVRATLARVRAALPPEGLFYVRASVPVGGRAAYEVPGGGRYRLPETYERWFVDAGFRVLEARTSAELAALGRGARSPGAARSLVAQLAGRVEQARRARRGHNDYMSWFLRPAV